MPEQLIANYINKKRIDAGLTYEAIAIESDIPESTVKNLCSGKTKNPGIETVMPIMEAVGGSYDEMLYPNKSKDEVKETSMLAMKDIYENQLNAIKESNEREVSNVRSHYEQHHQDLVNNFTKVEEQYEKRLEASEKYINKLEITNHTKTIIICLLAAIPIVLFILEIMHPEHGWLRY